MDRVDELSEADAARVRLSWDLQDQVNELLFELREKVWVRAAMLALSRDANAGRVDVSRADILEAARSALPSAVADFERAMGVDLRGHVRKAS